MKSASNPELYEEMNAPYPSDEEAKAALDAFFEEMVEVRKRHRIGNVVCIASAQAPDDATFSTYGHCGDSRYIVPLLMHALKSERVKRAEPLARIDQSIREVLGEK